jgi:hypothetical protein
MRDIGYLIKKLINRVLSFIIWKWRGHLRTPYIDLRVMKLTKQAKRFKNKHLGESCFIIGNGPSLTVEDLNMIGKVPSFSSNRINLILEKTKWKPYYYTFTDSIMATKFFNEVNSMEKKQMIIVITNYGFDALKKYFSKREYIFLRACRKKENNGFPKFSSDISRKIFTHGTVTYANIQLAVYMGFKNIYLIGVDHNYAIEKKEDGTVEINQEMIGKDHFDKNYYNTWLSSGSKPISDTSAMTKSYVSAKRYCETNGIRIFNATRGGKLDVFPRVNFEDLFDKNEKFLGVQGEIN